MPAVRGTRVPTSSRRAPGVVAGALAVLLAASGVAWAELEPASPAAAAPSAAPVTVPLPDTAPAPAAGPAALPLPGAVDAAATGAGQVTAAVGRAAGLTCSVVDGLSLCSHEHEPATSAGAASGATAPAVPVACAGDGTSGNRVQVLYVRESTQPDRFASVSAALRQHVDVANGVFHRSSGGHRQVRVVTDGQCRAWIHPVTLAPGQAGSFQSMTQALRGAGHTRLDRKYLVFVDNDVACGLAEQYHDDRPDATNRSNSGNMFAAVHRRCWDGVLAAHELTHVLGGVQSSAPRSTGGYGHCVDQHDVMCYADGSGKPMSSPCPSGHASLLDCGRDDYFSVSPAPGSYLATRWNVADNSFLVGGGAARPTPPSSPTAVTSTRAGDQVTVRWQPPAQTGGGVTGYDVVDLETSASVLQAVDGSARSATVRLEPWRTYRIAVVARNAAGASAPAGGEPHTVGTAPAAPGAVLSTYSVSGADVRVQLVWAAPAHAVEYVVRRDGRRVGVARGTSWSDPERQPLGARHVYTVEAVNAWGVSAPSNGVHTVAL